MPVELIVIIAAIIIAWVIFTWLIKVIKASITTAVTIAAIALILQIFLGIGYEEVGRELIKLLQTIWQFFAE